MVRRLIQRFLHWLRQLLAHTNGAKHPPQPLKPKRQLPPPISPKAAPDVPPRSATTRPSPPQQPAANRLKKDTAEQQPPRTPLNPASPRAINPSRFRVLMSDYEYAPSSDIQELSRQLSEPQPPTIPSDQQQTSRPTAFTDEEKLTRKAPAPKIKQTTNRSIALPLPEEKKVSSKDKNNGQQTLSPTAGFENQIEAERISSIVTPQSIETPISPATKSNCITKQGVIKLLFKLKKNNHHGYIAPDDGSKDIIFHKKFIGSDVFDQLERGMTVEVTAHITEGKAYADHIRIL